jgi:peptide/nickel transport system substrate-binding protein
MNRRTLVLPALAGLLVPTLASCGDSAGGDPGTHAIVVGTTDRFTVSDEMPAPFDPAAGYEIGLWNVQRSIFQTLLRPPRSGTEPVPEAASECAFTDHHEEQYRCTLRSGLTFSNGHALTARDVVFSVRRMLKIGGELGPASLLSGVDRVEATNDTEVVFHLKKPDATFPYKLATPAAAILDSRTYPAHAFRKGFDAVGSGPYVLDGYDQDARRAVLVRNPDYKGTLNVKNNKIVLQSFDGSEEMEQALKAGDIDVMNRTIAPKQVNELARATSDRIDLFESPGQEIRYLVFQTDAPHAGQLAVRRAVAQTVDRQALVRDVYKRTAEPLYSLVPSGLPGHTNSFFNEYGDPDVSAARRTLADAGVDTPVRMTLHYTTDHYGAVTQREFEELKRQLDSTGLFDVDIEGTPWKDYRPTATKGKYEVYGFGWFPDFVDPDNFLAPFFTEDNFLKTPYVNEEIRNRLIPKERREPDRAAATGDFERAQDIIADEVPVLPLWQGKQYIAARDDITGVEWALNSASVLQLWELERGVKG